MWNTTCSIASVGNSALSPALGPTFASSIYNRDLHVVVGIGGGKGEGGGPARWVEEHFWTPDSSNRKNLTFINHVYTISTARHGRRRMEERRGRASCLYSNVVYF